MKKCLLGAAIACLNISAIAAVPHTFSAGTPAKAAEVNANFAHLDAQSSLPFKTFLDLDYSLTYTPVNSNPGDTVTIAGVEYATIRTEFFDTYSGKLFRVTGLTKTAEISISLQGHSNSSFVAEKTHLSTLDIGSDIKMILSMDPHTQSPGWTGPSVDITCRVTPYFQLSSGTVLRMGHGLDKEQVAPIIEISQYETKLATTPSFTCPSVSEVDQFIDYMKIEEITP